MSSQRTYTGHGLVFHYPTDWTLSEDASDGVATVSLQTPGAAFWSLTVFADRPAAEDVLGAVLAAYRDDYPELDIYGVSTTICQLPAEACDLDFVCFDLVSSAALRSFETLTRTFLIVYQGQDREIEQFRADFERIISSLHLDSEEFESPYEPTDSPDEV